MIDKIEIKTGGEKGGWKEIAVFRNLHRQGTIELQLD